MAGDVTADEVHGIVVHLTELTAQLTAAAQHLTDNARALNNASQYEMAQWATERGRYRDDVQVATQRITEGIQTRWWQWVGMGLIGWAFGIVSMWWLQ